MPANEFPSISDFSPEELIFMADEHDDKAFAMMIKNHPAMRAGDDFYDFLSGLDNPFGNMVFGMKVPDPSSTVASVTERLEETGAPAYWWLGPCTTPSDVDSFLLDAGWKDYGTAPCMVVDLAKLEDPISSGVALKEVTTLQELSDWQVVFAKSYELPLDIARILAPELGGGMRLFTALKDGVPVGTTGLFTYKGVPGIYCVATHPKFRGQGIGAAITALPLIEARKQGYKMGTLQASQMGYPVYKRIGFQDVCNLRIFTYNIS